MKIYRFLVNLGFAATSLWAASACSSTTTNAEQSDTTTSSGGATTDLGGVPSGGPNSDPVVVEATGTGGLSHLASSASGGTHAGVGGDTGSAGGGTGGSAGGADGGRPVAEVLASGGAGGKVPAEAGVATGGAARAPGACATVSDCPAIETYPGGCAETVCTENHRCEYIARDADGDQYVTRRCLSRTPGETILGIGTDCDDADPKVNPMAWDGPAGDGFVSGCNDGLDNDCTGAIDDGQLTNGATCTCTPGELAVCPAGENRCGGGEVELIAEQCAADGSAFLPQDFCVEANQQCNPTTGACIRLNIDEAEVTVSDYANFNMNRPSTSGQAPGCQWNSSFAPDADCLSSGRAAGKICDPGTDDCDTHPQVCIDWCDATMYCETLGKYLCGRMGPQPKMNPFDRYADAGSSEWMNACSAGGQYRYGAGSSIPIDPLNCTYEGTQIGITYPIKSRSKCKSPSPGYNAIHDLSGNVAEWENSCERDAADTTANESDACRTRGGSFESPLGDLGCGVVPASALKRSSVSPVVGFRCCG